MPTAFSAPADALGMTLSAASVPHAFIVMDVTLPEIKLGDIKTSNMATTVAHTYIPEKSYEGGELKFGVQFSPDTSITAMVGVSDTWTLTFPKSPSSAATAATWAWSGYVNSYTGKAPVDGLLTGEVSIKVAGAITVTGQA
jgi:hypothetical protein